MDAIVLCGGKGTRLASVVSDVPKPLAPVGGRPFLDYVLNYLVQSGQVTRAILATGHLAQTVVSTYGRRFGPLAVDYSEEQVPLGTGGAVLQALRRFELTAPFFVLNGDSFVDADLRALAERLAAPDTKVALSLYHVADASRFGTVTCDGDRVTRFAEKQGKAEPGWINAGIYALRADALTDWKDDSGRVSLEEQMLPGLAARRAAAALQTGTRFIDIGLPETYASATAFFRDSGVRSK